MKKLLSILLAAMLLCGVMGVGLQASAATDISVLAKPLSDFLASVNLEDLSNAQIKVLIDILEKLKKVNINYVPLIEAMDDGLPFAVKAALHEAGLMNYPIWERDAMMHLVFKYLLFGWIWMDGGSSSIFPWTLFGL